MTDFSSPCSVEEFLIEKGVPPDIVNKFTGRLCFTLVAILVCLKTNNQFDCECLIELTDGSYCEKHIFPFSV